jgi:hypothetical protein
MYKTPINFHIGMRGGAPDLCSPLKILFTDWRLIPLLSARVRGGSLLNRSQPELAPILRSLAEASILAVLRWHTYDHLVTVQRLL